MTVPPRTLLDHVYTSSGTTASSGFVPAAMLSISRSRFQGQLGSLALMTAFVGPSNYDVDVVAASSAGPFRVVVDTLIPGEARGDEFEQCQPLIDAISDILAEGARVRGIDASEITVSRFVDPDESAVELVVTQQVDLPAEDALAYWDAIGADIQQWISRLPRDDAERATRHIAVNIQWRDAESARL